MKTNMKTVPRAYSNALLSVASSKASAASSPTAAASSPTVAASSPAAASSSDVTASSSDVHFSVFHATCMDSSPEQWVISFYLAI